MKKKLLDNLDEISKYSIYSKLNNNLEKFLGERSLKAFVKESKKPKKLKKINYLEEVLKKFPKHTSEYKDPNDYISQIINRKLDFNKDDKKILKSEPYENYPIKSIKNYYRKKEYVELITKDPYRYNPNYNAIYKKVPYAYFSSSKRQNTNNDKDKRLKNNATSFDLKVNGIRNNTKDYRTIETDRNIEKSKINKSSNINTIKLPIIKPSNYNNDYSKIKNDNHALRFSKYGNSKIRWIEDRTEVQENLDEKFTINNNKNNHNHNLKKIKRNHSPIDFDKMMSRKDNDFVNPSTLENPSFNNYSPNYNFIKDSVAKISFSYHTLENNDVNKKKYLLKKMISSYNADSDDIHYRIIEEDKLKPSKSIVNL